MKSGTWLRCFTPPAAGLVCLLVASAGLSQNAPYTRITNQAEWNAFTKRLAPPWQRAGMSADVSSNGITFSMSPSKYNGPNCVQAEVRLPNIFQMEVKYELHTFPDKIQNGFGAGVGLWVEGAAVDGQARAVRSVEPNRGPHFMAGRTVPLANGKTHYAIAMTPAESRNGRLGLRRMGNEIAMLASETPDGPLEEYQRYPLSDAPTRLLSLYTTTGGCEVQLTARLYDLRILSGPDLPPEPPKRKERTVTIVPLPPRSINFEIVKTAEEVPEHVDPPASASASPISPWSIGLVTFLLGLPLGVFIGRKWKTTKVDLDAHNRGRDDE